MSDFSSYRGRLARAVTYSVADTNGTRATAVYQVDVTPVSPIATDDTDTTPQNTPVTRDLLANDTAGSPDAPLIPGTVRLALPADAPANATLSADGKTVTVPGQGTWVVDDQGVLTFTPDVSFTGTAMEVPYSVEDTNGTRATATYQVTVTPVTPIATDDTDTTPQNTPVTTNVLGNDIPGSDTAPLVPDTLVFPNTGQPAGSTVSTDGKTVTVPGQGTWVVDGQGVLTFTPEAGFSGTAMEVPYSVEDTNGTRATAVYQVTVTPVTPVATDDRAQTPPGTPVTVSVLDNDNPGSPSAPLDPTTVQLEVPAKAPAGTTLSPDGKKLTVPGEGTYTVGDDGSITFTPEPGFRGTATPVPYTVKDSNGTSATAVLTVRVATTGLPPITKTTPVNTPTSFPTKVVKGGYFLDHGKPSTKLHVKGGTFTVDPNTGKVTFTPDKGFVGKVPPVTLYGFDRPGNPVSQVIHLTVTPKPVRRRTPRRRVAASLLRCQAFPTPACRRPPNGWPWRDSCWQLWAERSCGSVGA